MALFSPLRALPLRPTSSMHGDLSSLLSIRSYTQKLGLFEHVYNAIVGVVVVL
jgi:hypothetical protein